MCRSWLLRSQRRHLVREVPAPDGPRLQRLTGPGRTVRYPWPMSRRAVLLTLFAVTLCGCGQVNHGIGSPSPPPPSSYVERTTTTTPSETGLTTEPIAEPVPADGRLL